ncbi:MAG: AMP-dependent synthetase/ligase [Arthrobacter sp.]|uniref:AMP-dependent synthetase/ligase n=1 Tax=unclassified Arthrobacter TaxID=235627 RepID=UPI00265650E4|nr:long-chain fatty acid--CoA ligase [Micrococcaceae bacterium]MDN5813186.1 long-chain fatty acid--CoA ligase [Micrococcaceae bacterium]MDN5824930.1 long-chain fatty acid--CoA ligase [Micrococcaceae bacterium]MDN5878301.1 long-chain fatty acid--CoA ligase [Micrococcaceae bacterium]MDN5886443.1 long-chain fatty acid--CoA ligase [Micrococcaceae bacterium]
MREFSVPPLVVSPATSNTTDFVLEKANGTNPMLFSRPDGHGGWIDVSAREFRDDASALAKGLIAAGLEKGSRIGIMSRTRYEWTLVDFAIWFAGCISVPVYETSSPSQVAWILGDCGAAAAIVESPNHENVIRQASIQEQLEDIGHIWQMDGDGLDVLRSAGTGVSDEELEARRSSMGLETVATIIYTSGTTGRPKGCELTHLNFVELSRNAQEALPECVHEGSSTIMFLPLAHVFARFISVLAVAGGAKVAHTPDIKNLLPDLQGFKPTFILAVPRVFEKVYNSSMLKAEDASNVKARIFHAAAKTAVQFSRAQGEGSVPLALKLRHGLFDKLVFSKIREAMGGRIQYAVSGGGPLGERLGHFFNGAGLMILEGYGLTETTAPITVNTPSKLKIGTVGRPLPGNAVKIADDGEILTRGVCLMAGYHNRPDLRTEAFDDDWFRTGDIGELDSDGFLKITGRKKEILVTASGKNVIPGLLEDQIRADALVSQALVVGDNRPFISALVTLDEEALPGWLGRHQLGSLTVEQAAEHPKVRQSVQAVIDKANQTVSHAEAIKAFRIVPTDFSEASGHLTPSLKVKRAQVLKDFETVVEEIYTAKKPS